MVRSGRRRGRPARAAGDADREPRFPRRKPGVAAGGARLVVDEFLLMNVDHIYRAPIAALASADATDVTAFIDTDRTLGADDMKVERDARGRVSRISKTLATFDAGYVGMTKVPVAAADRYWAAVQAAQAEEGRAIHVERVLARLADERAPAALPRHQRSRLAGGRSARRARPRRRGPGAWRLRLRPRLKGPSRPGRAAGRRSAGRRAASVPPAGRSPSSGTRRRGRQSRRTAARA